MASVKKDAEMDNWEEGNDSKKVLRMVDEVSASNANDLSSSQLSAPQASLGARREASFSTESHPAVYRPS